MSDPKKILVDVVSLSKQRCTHPIQCDLKYATSKNFVGRIITGYHPAAKEICLLTKQPAEKLCLAQNYLIEKFNYGLLVFDAYRPLRAVQDWALWSTQAPTAYELERKQKHYPHLAKQQLAQQGYIAVEVSRHCFGGTVDLTLIEINTGKELNMGARFDYFDETAHATAPASLIGAEAYQNRKILAEAMQCFGFQTYAKEYWHFDYEPREIAEPLDIEITAGLQGLGVK